MAVMNPVWPINALYLGPVALWAYWTIGREQSVTAHDHHSMNHAAKGLPTWRQVFKGTMHCGAGCTLGDSGFARGTLASRPGMEVPVPPTTL